MDTDHPLVDHLRVITGGTASAPVLLLRGELDLASGPVVAAALARAARGATAVVVDCAELDFVDVAGIGALHRARAELVRGGVTFTVRSPSSPLRRLALLVGLPELTAER